MLELRLYIPFLALNIGTVLHWKFFGNVTLPAAFLVWSGCPTTYVINDPLPSQAAFGLSAVTPRRASPCICACRCYSRTGSSATVGWRGWHSPLMTSCRFTWLLGRLCRVPGGTSSRQPGGSSGSSSSPDRPGSPSSPGSGLWDRGLVRVPAWASQGGHFNS